MKRNCTVIRVAEERLAKSVLIVDHCNHGPLSSRLRRRRRTLLHQELTVATQRTKRCFLACMQIRSAKARRRHVLRPV